MKTGDLVRLKKSHRSYSLTVRDLETYKGLIGVSCKTPMLVVEIEKLDVGREKKNIVSVLCNNTVVDFISEKLTTRCP
mgnify:CR=1 FL=1